MCLCSFPPTLVTSLYLMTRTSEITHTHHTCAQTHTHHCTFGGRWGGKVFSKWHQIDWCQLFQCGLTRARGRGSGIHFIVFFVCSPCGKKFRSKPQIARYLGDKADLSVFDFSRAGTPGDGTSRRRARDRSARKAIELGRQVPSPARPLFNDPLGPSGPIRRTCGMIRLPVTALPPSDDNEETKRSMIREAESSLIAPSSPHHQPTSSTTTTTANPNSANATSSTGNTESDQTDRMDTADGGPSSLSPPSSPVSAVLPKMWANRLLGVMVYDHLTGSEIQVGASDKELHNGLDHHGSENSTSGGEGKPQGMPSSGALAKPEKSSLNILLTKQQQQHHTQQHHHHADKKLGPSSRGTIVPSLLAHKNQGTSGGSARQTSSLKAKDNLKGQQQQQLGGIFLALPTNTNTSLKAKQQSQQRQILARPPSMTKTASAEGCYVSETELRLQEEKVRLLREQLLAAQSTV